VSGKIPTACYVRFDDDLCTGCAACLKVCPTRAIRLKQSKSIRIVDRCIGCGECIRICQAGAVSATTIGPKVLSEDHIAVALVSPVLYAQFPGVMPKDILLGLRRMGFQHTIDMSYFLEMFQCATEEFIRRNKQSQKAYWPLISPVCPVVVRLIAFHFQNLMPHILPVLRPAALMAREVKRQIIPEYVEKKQDVVLYYINPCPTKIDVDYFLPPQITSPMERAIGINDIYPELVKHLQKIAESDMIDFSQIEHSLAVSGLEETMTYLKKIELGLFRDIEYIEFRTCREGCLGGVLTAIDKYLAKSAVQKMIKRFGLGRRLPHESILRLYEKGQFQLPKTDTKLMQLFSARKKALSIETLQKIDEILELIQGNDCASCGAPDCRTFAEDVVRGNASLEDCILLRTPPKNENTRLKKTGKE
jgi:Na+-translocating ferredoxin:NAD+ oxidoreductase RNF subunit RnfB